MRSMYKIYDDKQMESDYKSYTSKIAEDMVGAVTVNKSNAQALSEIISKFNGN